MTYRTKTYIAAEWDGDSNAVEQLKKWNDNDYWGLSFSDAHDLTQARDTSLNCSIKTSLKTRLDATKTFVLIVGKNTKTVRSGSCHYCSFYDSSKTACEKGKTVDFLSYIDYECNVAINDAIRSVVLYNAATVDKDKCPDCIKYHGTHVAMQKMEDGKHAWDYQAVKKAVEG